MTYVQIDLLFRKLSIVLNVLIIIGLNIQDIEKYGKAIIRFNIAGICQCPRHDLL